MDVKLVIYLQPLDSDILQKNVQIVWMFDVTRYKYCDADAGGGGKNAQHLNMNILLDLDRMIYVSDIRAQQRDLKRDLIATEYSDVLPICC